MKAVQATKTTTKKNAFTRTQGEGKRQRETVGKVKSQAKKENRKCQKYLTEKFILNCIEAEQTARCTMYIVHVSLAKKKKKRTN